MKVQLTAKARRDVDSIWAWNASERSPNHADRYLEFLLSEIDGLREGGRHDSQVPDREGLFFRVIKRRTRGHGHIAVYRFRDDSIEVLHVFHTAMDWHGRL